MPPARQGSDRPSGAPRALQRALQAILPKITETLAAALSGVGQAEPDWTNLEWQIARAVAVIHGISPLLSQRLGWKGAPGWRAFLEAQRVHTAARYLRMARLLDEIDARAAVANIAFVPLKGEALHAVAIYAAGDRPMADIDLLVRPQDLEAMNELITKQGYRSVSVSADEHVLVPVNRPQHVHLAEHTDNGITIEVHTSISRSLPVRVLDITSGLWPSTPRPGRNNYSSNAALMRHLLMHVAVNMQMRVVRMIQLHDIALLTPRLSALDWDELLYSESGGAALWWAMPPLQLVRRYYPQVIPQYATDAVAPACAALLKIASSRLRIADVSVSNPRRPIFPGLSWAGSPSEALRCVSMRLHRGTQALGGGATLAAATEIQPWITNSHRRRMFDVLLGRPRPETMLMIVAALDGDASFGSRHEQPNVA
jgi:hypothetical protein